MDAPPPPPSMTTTDITDIYKTTSGAGDAIINITLFPEVEHQKSCWVVNRKL